jgi:hypothetical protein
MASKQPSFRAFTVIKRDKEDDFWLDIGAAFPHEDGKGYNIVLQALPIDGRVVLRVPRDDDTHQRPERTPVTSSPGYAARRK